MPLPFRFLNGQEQAALAVVLADYIIHNPKYKTDPTITGLLKKFKVARVEAGIEEGTKEKVGAVLADLKAGIRSDRIAKLHDLPISVVEEIKMAYERNGTQQ